MSVRDTALQRRLETVGETLVSGDADRTEELYTEEGRLIPPGSDFVTERATIAEYWQGVREAGVDAIDVETVDVEDHRSVIIRVGLATLTDADGTTLDRVKFVETWKREDGTWRIDNDIWNSNTPGRG